MAPSSRCRLTFWIRGEKRVEKPIIPRTPAPSTAATISRACPPSVARGFSQKTCLPCRAAASTRE